MAYPNDSKADEELPWICKLLQKVYHTHMNRKLAIIETLKSMLKENDSQWKQTMMLLNS